MEIKRETNPFDQSKQPTSTNPFHIPLEFNPNPTRIIPPVPSDPPPPLYISSSSQTSGQGKTPLPTIPTLRIPSEDEEDSFNTLYPSYSSAPQPKTYFIPPTDESNPTPTTYSIPPNDGGEDRFPTSNISAEDPTYHLDQSMDRFVNNAVGGSLYFYIKRALEMGWTDFFRLSFSLGVTAGALTFYYTPNIKYAKGDLLLEIAFVLGALATNGFGTFYIASQVFNSFVNELPPEYRVLINKDHEKNKLLAVARMAFIAILSLVAASPLAFAADLPLELKIILCLCTSVTSYLALDKYVRRHSQYIYHKLFSSLEAKKYQTLLASFRHTIETVSRELVKLKQLPEEVRPNNKDIHSKELLQFFARKAKEFNVKAPSPMTPRQLIFRRYLPAFFGVVLSSGLLIYVIRTYERLSGMPNWDNPFNATRNTTDDSFDDSFIFPITGGISIPFLYLGYTFAISACQWVADAISGNSEKPLAFQLHPVKTFLTMLAIFSMVSFSYGTIAQLLEEDPYFNKYFSNEEHPNMRIFVLALCITSALIFNLVPSTKLGLATIEELTRRFGQDKDEKERAHFMLAIEEFLEKLDDMSSLEFGNSFNEFTPEEIHLLLPTYSLKDEPEEILLTLTKDNPTPNNYGSSFISNLGDEDRQRVNDYIQHHDDDQVIRFLQDPEERKKVLKASPQAEDTSSSEESEEGFVKSCTTKLSKISGSCFSFLNKFNPLSKASNYQDLRDSEENTYDNTYNIV
jgi:hypothetical protein